MRLKTVDRCSDGERWSALPDVLPAQQQQCAVAGGWWSTVWLLPLTKAMSGVKCTAIVECLVVDRNGERWNALIGSANTLRLEIG